VQDLGRALIAIGVVVAIAGVALVAVSRLGGVPIPLGRLPGDVVIKRDGFSLYLPITTSVLVSAVLSAVLYLLRR
jgi:Protein of unknown function (DUF2905)